MLFRSVDDGGADLPLIQPLVSPTVTSPGKRVVEVGSLTPAEDFQELLRQGRPLNDGTVHFAPVPHVVLMDPLLST